jgi:hypothetical protein
VLSINSIREHLFNLRETLVNYIITHFSEDELEKLEVWPAKANLLFSIFDSFKFRVVLKQKMSNIKTPDFFVIKQWQKDSLDLHQPDLAQKAVSLLPFEGTGRFKTLRYNLVSSIFKNTCDGNQDAFERAIDTAIENARNHGEISFNLLYISLHLSDDLLKPTTKISVRNKRADLLFEMIKDIEPSSIKENILHYLIKIKLAAKDKKVADFIVKYIETVKQTNKSQAEYRPVVTQWLSALEAFDPMSSELKDSIHQLMS